MKRWRYKLIVLSGLIVLVFCSSANLLSLGSAHFVSSRDDLNQDVKAELEAIKAELEEHRKVTVQLVETLKTSTLKVDVTNPPPSTIKLDTDTKVAVTSLPAMKQEGEWKVKINDTSPVNISGLPMPSLFRVNQEHTFLGATFECNGKIKQVDGHWILVHGTYQRRVDIDFWLNTLSVNEVH